MKKYIPGAIWLCVILALLAPDLSSGAEGPKSFLWKIETTSGTSYLCGSVHLARSDIYPLPAQLEESFAKSDVLALEADPGKGVNHEVRLQMVRSALYPDGDSLIRHISRKTYHLASAELKRSGIPIEQFVRSKPWFLAMTIELLTMQQLGYSPEYGLDLYFAGQAKGNKQIVELESFNYQISLLNSFNDREQELFLFYTIKDLATIRGEIAALMRAWRSGDLDAMERIVTRALNDYPEIRPIYEKLYYQRNRAMAGKIETLLRSGHSAFIVVGAAHLVGKEGLVELLKRRGYVLEQL